jgi:hypothetical protein
MLNLLGALSLSLDTPRIFQNIIKSAGLALIVMYCIIDLCTVDRSWLRMERRVTWSKAGCASPSEPQYHSDICHTITALS